MTQLDLFAPCTSPHVQASTPTRTPPPRRLAASMLSEAAAHTPTNAALMRKVHHA